MSDKKTVKEAALLLVEKRLQEMNNSTHQGDALEGWSSSDRLTTNGHRLANRIEAYIAQMQGKVDAFKSAVAYYESLP